MRASISSWLVSNEVTSRSSVSSGPGASSLASARVGQSWNFAPAWRHAAARARAATTKT